MTSINFANRAQVILYECELKGQISDGNWEDSKPYDHWERMCNAQATNDSAAPLGCVGFYPIRKYNFADSQLVEIVGDRMVWFVKVYTAFPEFSFDKHWDYDDVSSLTKVQLAKVNAIVYTHKDLMRDLRQMKNIVNGDCSRG